LSVRLWTVILLVDLTLALGAGGGYLWWARENRILRQELAEARRAADARQPAAQAWTVRAIVRLVQRSQGVVWLTHEAIPGLMEGMTMPFEAEREQLLDGLAPGDPVRFTLRQQGSRLLVVAIEKEAQR
jgi:Cu/Ag efflux protein CusF